ncbi:hypothetical protein N0V90_006592 [Kalmusia sp. IMI 367209]|nr:hypothetical protein N0V90_006592 [Kalmusia sp. IMI 367209]
MPQLSSSLNPEQLGLSAQRAADSKPRLPSKRKRDSICGLGTFTKPFTIRPCPGSSYDKPYTFKPVRIIARSQLPLSFLDTATNDGLTTNQLFSCSIDVLEQFYSETCGGFPTQNVTVPRVLIARYETKKTLYAVERVRVRVYSLCKIASWLKERDVGDLWDPENLQAYPVFLNAGSPNNSVDAWWKHASVEVQPVDRPAKRARLTMLRPIPRAEPVESQMIPQLIEAPTVEESQTQAIPIETLPDTIKPPALLTSEEQLHNLVQQYLDATYISKTSLAYFAKGPITRIRNAFTSSEEGAPALHELVTFLRSMLLTHKAEEKKYREKLPEVIKALPPGCFSDEDLVDVATKPKKTRKKIKLSRDGMYPQEVDIVRKWWFTNISTAEIAREETMEQRIKRRLSELRVREALIQMILILEITALESLTTYKEPIEGQEAAATESQATGESQTKSKKRKKKLDDVNLLLDLLLDKLCIWQSVEQEGVLDFDAKKQDEGHNGPAGKDRLQSFCVEVIIPFYMNRLPEQARLVNKKLGGPAPSSPFKRKAMKPPTTSRKSGESKEPDSKKSRRSLGRVTTDTTGRIGYAQVMPSLNRSATDSIILNGIKREGSEVPLSAIPFQRSPSAAARQSMSHLKLLKGREMDLNTSSAAAAARAKQRKRVEEDLQEAISALKKPNRGLVAGSYADDIEKRSLVSTNRSRKPANPVRKIVKDVLVSATPRAGRRTKEIVEQTPVHQRNPFFRPRQSDAPSSDFCIPSSAARPASSVVPATVQRSATVRTLAPQGVAETPSRPPAGRTFSMPIAASMAMFATPSKHRTMSPGSPPRDIEATPTKVIASSPPDHSNLAPTPRTLFATPFKRAATAQVAESPVPALSNPKKTETEPSIYDALGWNDDDFI